MPTNGVTDLPRLTPPPTDVTTASEPAPASPVPSTPVEITVRGSSAAERLRRSAHAVEVVELAQSERSSADLGEVLARKSSLQVRREGGLGSMGRYSLNGLSGDRVRFFLDGVPLELTAYQMGVGNVPIGLVDRAEVYQGVVPVRFGADALGGAVNLVSDEAVQANRLGASYEFASFETHRMAVSGRAYSEKLRGFARASLFFDVAANDYPVDAQVFDDSGQVSSATVRRFHDGYRGAGVTLGAGLVQRAWADRLIAQAYVADYARDVQTNAGMTVPYGEVTYGRGALGGNVSYRKRFARIWRLDAQVGYAGRVSRLRDVSRCRYDWYGRCFVMLPLAGELDSVPVDRTVNERTLYGRIDLTVSHAPQRTLTLSLSPRFVTRRGHDREIPDRKYDPLRAERRLYGGVLGLEYEVKAGRLAAATFVKQYLQAARSSARLSTGVTQQLRTNQLYFGAGDSLRLTILPSLYVKASFEQAVRLPTADERFGDGGLIADNLQLEPETSQNVNLGAFVESTDSALGIWRGKLSAAARRIESLVVLLGTGSYYQYANVLQARALATEAGVAWSSRSDAFGLEANVSYQDVRNTSTTGPGALFEGDRIPNQPFFQVSAAARARFEGALTAGDALELSWDVRHVRRFFRGWESAAASGAKLEVPSQTVHALALSHVSNGPGATLTNSFEVQNLLDAKVFDFYGAARPGRSFHWKMSLEYQ